MITRIAIGLLWLIYSLLPLRVLTWFGERLGDLLYLLPTSRRRIGQTNLRLCFPEQSSSERRQLLKAHFRAMGRALAHESVAWWGTRELLESFVKVEGFEHFQAHMGKPALLFSMHFTGLSVGGMRIATLHDRGIDLYAPIRNPVLNDLAMRTRSRFGDHLLIPRSAGIKPVLRALKQGQPLYYFPDLDYGRKDALFVPFFGIPAATITGLARLAKAAGAVVIPVTTRWQGDHYELRYYPAWQDYPSADIEADVRRMNAFIEERVRETPEQYFWLHKRFKTRPEGEPSLYG